MHKQYVDEQGWSLKRLLAVLAIAFLTMVGIVSVPSSALAAPNPAIAVDSVTIGEGSGENGQLVIGDKVTVSGTWDATSASPKAGDEFSVELPSELSFPEAVPFQLLGPNGTVWADCTTVPGEDRFDCTLTDEVTAAPELVHGTFEFEVEVVAATEESELNFRLNGKDVPVELPGGGGIDDGIVIPDTWGKTGEMNDNNWSMTWKIDLPGQRLHGNEVVNITDTLSTDHSLCDPESIKVQTVRGDNVVDVSDLLTLTEQEDHKFTMRLNAPEGGFDSNVTYRIVYETCTPEGKIFEEGHKFTNQAYVDIWGENSGVIGVPSKPWHLDLSKHGSVLGGGERNGTIAWTVVIPGKQLFGKDGFNITETLGDGHEVTQETLDGLQVYEQYGPSADKRKNITEHLKKTVNSSTESTFDVQYDIEESSEFVFQDSDWRYTVTYTTKVTETDLPTGGTGYTNEVDVDGKVARTEAKVPSRTDEKTGKINTGTVELDGVKHSPQTTLDWAITVPGERLQAVEGDLVVTDKLSESHQVCAAGDSSDGLAAQLGLRVDARDQIDGGGLETVDITDRVSVAETDEELKFTIAEPTLPNPQGSKETGFSTEYQYVILYTTCTTSGGMDAPGTVYGNEAEVAGKTYTSSMTQNNRGSGTGQGVTRGSVSLTKSLADTPGAEYVPEGTEFTVHVQEIDPNGTVQLEYDLQVPLDGEPVSGPNSRGLGWTAKLSEPTFPSVPGVTFGTPKFIEGEGITVGDEGASAIAELKPGTNIEVSLENTVQLGAVSLEKLLEGGAAGEVDSDQTYNVTAQIDTSAINEDFPSIADREIELKAGTPVTLEDLPIGSIVTFTETVPENGDQFTWGTPVFDPEELTITEDHVSEPAVVTLTNNVERTVGTFSIMKEISGEQADNPAVPDEVTVTAAWDEEGVKGEKTLTLPTDGTPVSLDENLLIGTQVTLTETALSDGSGIVWKSPTWTGESVETDGDSAIVTVTRDAEALISLENHAVSPVAELTIFKSLSGDGAQDVSADTEFPVTATWVDSEGETQVVDTVVRAGQPATLEGLPVGVEVALSEGKAKTPFGVKWNGASWSVDSENVTMETTDEGATVVIEGDRNTEATVNLENSYEKPEGLASTGGTFAGVAVAVALLLLTGGAVVLMRKRRVA